MKRIIFTFFILILCVSVQSQSIKGVVIGGMNISQVDGDEIYGFNKIGFNVGFGAIAPITKKWSFSVETLYNEKGSYQKIQKPNDSLYSGEYKLKLNYLEVPFLIHYTDKDFITIGAGVSWGRLIKVYENEHSNIVGWDLFDANMPYDRNDINIIADVRLRAWRQFYLNFRYQYSIDKIRTREYTPVNQLPWTRNQYNNYFSVRLLWIFNEKPPTGGWKTKKKEEN